MAAWTSSLESCPGKVPLLIGYSNLRPGNKDARHAPGVCVWELAGRALYWRFGIGVCGSDARPRASTCACMEKGALVFFLLLVIFYKSKTTVMLQTSQSKTKSTQPSIAALFFSSCWTSIHCPVGRSCRINRTNKRSKNTRWRWKRWRDGSESSLGCQSWKATR